MSTSTTNEGLVKPDGGDLYDISVLNANLDKLDAKVSELRELIKAASSIKDGSITGSKIAENTISTSKYGGGSVGENALADRSVTSPKIAEDAVTGDKIAADAIGNEQLAQNAVAAENIVNGAIGTYKIADASVTPTKLANGSVTSVKIADGSITTEKLGPGIIQSDTGWVPLQLNTSAGAGFNATWGTEWTPKYRKVGNLVQIVGAITPNSTRVIDATLQKIATLPASIRPAVAVSSPQQGGGRRIWTIRANGSDLTAEKLRYDNTDYLSATAGGEVMQFCLAYFV